MAKPDGVFVYVGTYPDEMSARDDYEIVKDLHAAGAVGTYDASVVTKDENGKVHVNKDETSTRHGAWGGAAVGAVVGILFPPSLIGSAIVGAGVGGVGGHLWKGMSRADVKEFGELIDTGEAALVIVGESTLESALDKADLKAGEAHLQRTRRRELQGHRSGSAGRSQRSELTAFGEITAPVRAGECATTCVRTAVRRGVQDQTEFRDTREAMLADPADVEKNETSADSAASTQQGREAPTCDPFEAV